MWATVPQPPQTLAGIFKSSRKSRFMFTLASFTKQARAFDKGRCSTSGKMEFIFIEQLSQSSPKGVTCILAWILFFFHLSSASVTQATGRLLIYAADSSVTALLFALTLYNSFYLFLFLEGCIFIRKALLDFPVCLHSRDPAVNQSPINCPLLSRNRHYLSALCWSCSVLASRDHFCLWA